MKIKVPFKVDSFNEFGSTCWVGSLIMAFNKIKLFSSNQDQFKIYSILHASWDNSRLPVNFRFNFILFWSFSR